VVYGVPGVVVAIAARKYDNADFHGNFSITGLPSETDSRGSSASGTSPNFSRTIGKRPPSVA
jgi:hypothetical protein